MCSTRPPDSPVSRRSKMMQVYFFGRWSRSLILAYTPCVVHLSRVASNPAGEYMSRGGPFPMTSYRVLMSSITAVGMSTAPDLPARTHIVDQSTEGIEAQLRGVAVGPGLGVDPLRRVADGGMRQAHASVEPRPSAQAPDHRNGNRAYDGRTGYGTRVPEVQNRGAGLFQPLCFLHQLVFDGHFRVRRVPPEIHADRVAHRYEIYPGAVRDLRDLVVPGDHSDDLSPVALHLLERRNRRLGFHFFMPGKHRRAA